MEKEKIKIFAKNIGQLTLAEAVIKVILFFWTIFLARNLGADSFGQYNFVNSFIALFSLVPDLGISLVLIREISQDKKRAAEYFGNTLIINAALSFLVCLSILLISRLFPYSPIIKLALLLAALNLALTACRTTAMVLFNAFEKMNLVAFFNCLNSLFLVIFGYLGLILIKGIVGIFAGLLIGTVFSGTLVWLVVTKKTVAPRIHFNFSLVSRLLVDSWPLGLAGFFTLVSSRIDRLILSSLLDYQTVGWHSAALNLPTSAIQLFNVPLMIAAFPKLSRHFLEDKTRFAKNIKRLSLLILLWSFPLAMITTIFAKPLILFFYQSEYQSSIPVLQITAWYIILASLSAVFYRVLIIIKKVKTYLAITFAGACLNIGLNLILIPAIGYLGASWSILTAQLILLLLYVFTTRRYLSD